MWPQGGAGRFSACSGEGVVSVPEFLKIHETLKSYMV